MKTKHLSLIFVLLCLSGCGVIPTRIFQRSVPAPVQKQPAQLEAERQAADLLANGIKEPPSLIPVAQGLSRSLGPPAKPLPSATDADVEQSSGKALAALNVQIAKLQAQIDAQNKFLAKYAGKPIEGTGFDLIGPGMFALVVGLIALGVLCPPAMTVLFFILRRVKAAAGIVVSEVENAAKDPALKEAVGAIKSNVATAMQKHKQPTTALKAVITNLKH